MQPRCCASKQDSTAARCKNLCSSLQSETPRHCRPVYGLIFLFKWRQEADARVSVPESHYSGKVFFAQQVISNACATQVRPTPLKCPA